MNSLKTAHFASTEFVPDGRVKHPAQGSPELFEDETEDQEAAAPSTNPEPSWRRKRSWPEKFRDAFRGVALGVRGQNSFLVHSFFSLAALIAAAVFRISLIEWLIVGLCIVVVWTAEMFNSAFERLARAIRKDYDPQIRDALDIGSGAVLVAAIGAATIGSVLFLVHLLRVLGLPV